MNYPLRAMITSGLALSVFLLAPGGCERETERTVIEERTIEPDEDRVRIDIRRETSDRDLEGEIDIETRDREENGGVRIDIRGDAD